MTKVTPRKNGGWISGRRGFSLIELTIAITVSMLVATGCLMVMQVHTSFMREVTSFRFLRDEAPQVNSLVTQLVSKADSYRIHSTPGDAFAAVSAVNIAGKAVRLIYRNPSGLIDESVIAFETDAGGVSKLNYYRYQNGGWQAQPDWTISSEVADAVFSDDSGVLLVALTGPNGEEVTYAGTTQ